MITPTKFFLSKNGAINPNLHCVLDKNESSSILILSAFLDSLISLIIPLRLLNIKPFKTEISILKSAPICNTSELSSSIKIKPELAFKTPHDFTKISCSNTEIWSNELSSLVISNKVSSSRYFN